MDEPNFAIRWAMAHFASGDSYLFGLMIFVVCQIALLFVIGVRVRRWLIRVNCAALIWMVAVVPPVDLRLAGAFGLLLIVGLVSHWRNRKKTIAGPVSRDEQCLRISLAAVAVAGIVAEILHHSFRTPGIVLTSLCIVGDSVTAGLNDGDDTWPQQLARQVQIQILDASQPGATLKTAVKQVEVLKSMSGEVLLLEIGGNDLLEGLPPDQFEQNLDSLLSACQWPRRTVIMFELPTPPLSMRYARSQRQLAAKYQVTLVPRRQFLRVLTASGSTVDGIHLSAVGHHRMMGFVQKLLQIPPGKASGENYRHVEQPRKSANRP